MSSQNTLKILLNHFKIKFIAITPWKSDFEVVLAFWLFWFDYSDKNTDNRICISFFLYSVALLYKDLNSIQ